MKKLLTVLFSCLLVIFAVSTVSAAGDHIIIGDGEDILSSSDEYELEEDLDHIRDDYGIDIYFVLDSSVSDVEDYALSMVYAYYDGFNNTVVLCMNDMEYAIEVLGPEEDLIYANREDLFDTFYDSVSAYDLETGIRDYYQAIVRLVNSQNYSSDVDKVSGSPNFVDLAGLLSDSEENDIAKRLKEVSRRYGIEVVGVVTDSLNGMTPQNYADDFYDLNGYPDDGFILLISIEESDWYVSTRGKAIKYITDYGIDYMIDEMLPDLRNGDFYGAYKKYANAADYLLSSAKGGDIIDINTGPGSREEFGAVNIGIGAGIGAIVSFITTLIMKGKLKSVHKQRYARNYIVKDSFYLNGYADM
ncbi:MAG: TPM domain-containing protein, partial [Erysipelotrichaceae bacterium]|nr:TPM domain-containing protein [Erysipelotrichaceae bacterium]